MATELPNYEPMMARAVAEFWGVRERQAEEQRQRGAVDAGARGAVTGGQHLGPIEQLLRRVLEDAGVRPESIHNGRSARLPGYFRELKNWDVVVIEDGTLVAVIELKSQVGSFGNNLNNRIEEAIGQTVDFWQAAEKSIIPGLRPWFGYVMLVEASPGSAAPVRTAPSLMAPDSAFANKSYAERYAIAFERLHRERLLDAVTFAVSPRDTSIVRYPTPAMSFQHFATALHNRVREVQSLRS